MTADYKTVAQVVAGLLENASTSTIAEGLAAYLVAERTVTELDKIMREVERIRYEKDDVLEIDVTSTHELSSDIEQQVKDLFMAKKMIINKRTDANLVGGVKIQAQDTLIDLSVRGQLNKLKAHKF
jgi:F-type H+-transporting ATPase subunit delta